MTDGDDEGADIDPREQLVDVWGELKRHEAAIEKLEQCLAAIVDQRRDDRKWTEQRFRRMGDRLDAIVVKLKTIWQHLSIKGRKSRAVARESSQAEVKVTVKVTPPEGTDGP